MDINETTLLGRLGTNAEIGRTPSGKAVIKFRMATNKQYTDKTNEKKTLTQWHTVVYFARSEAQVDFLGSSLVKGSRVFVKGEYISRTWKDNDGMQRTFYEVRAMDITPLDVNQKKTEAHTDMPVLDSPMFQDDELPF